MSIAFTGSTRLEVVTVLSRTTATPESRNEALRTLITYIDSKKKRGKRSLEDVGSKLESLEATFGPFGLNPIFHQARLLTGLPPSSLPAVRDAGRQLPSSSDTLRSSISSGGTVQPASPSRQQFRLSPLASTGFLIPEIDPSPLLQPRPVSRSETYASSTFHGRHGFQAGNSSDEWEFRESPETQSSRSSGEEERERKIGTGRRPMVGSRSRSDTSVTGRPKKDVDPLSLAQERARKDVEDQIRALQLVLSHIGPTPSSSPSPPPPPPTPSPPMPSASQFPLPPSSRPRTLSQHRRPPRHPTSPPPPSSPPPPIPRHASLAPSFASSSTSSSYATSSLFSTSSSTASRTTSLSSYTSTYTASPRKTSQSLSVPPRTSSSSSSAMMGRGGRDKRHGSIFGEEDQVAGLGFLHVDRQGSPPSRSVSSWSSLSSPTTPSGERPPAYCHSHQGGVRETKEDEEEEEVVSPRPDSPALGMWELSA